MRTEISAYGKKLSHNVNGLTMEELYSRYGIPLDRMHETFTHTIHIHDITKEEEYAIFMDTLGQQKGELAQ